MPLGVKGGSWNLQFSANFASGGLDRSQWSTCYPWFHPCNQGTNFGNEELEWYLPAQDKVKNGTLAMEAKERPVRGRSSAGTPETYPWRSGILTTFKSFHFKYGFVQVLAKVPNGDGFWPALWLLPTSLQHPPEIDIVEVHGNDTSLALFTNIPTDGQNQQLRYPTADLSAGFHTYGLDWEPGSITWYLDGKPVFHVTAGVSNVPMYFLMNLAVDGKAGLSPSASTPKSGAFVVKSVEIWQHP